MLLKWGLDNLSKFTGTKGEHELSIILEAIKTKNSLIIERYKKSWDLYENLSELIFQLEEELDTFSRESPDTDGSWTSARKLMGNLKGEFHPKYYRKLIKLRAGFEGTNDMLAGYTRLLLELLKFDFLVSICKSNKIHSRGEIFRTYRWLWTKYGETTASIIRITSGDLRFWITEIPYIEHVDKWAEHDLNKLKKTFKVSNMERELTRLSVENKRGLDKFWYSLSDHHDNKSKS